MLVSTTTRTILIYVAVAVAFVGIAVFVARRAKATGWKRWLPLLPGVLGLAATVWLYTHDTQVVEVTDTDKGLFAIRKVNIGTNGFTLAPGTKELSSEISSQSWVVNRSAHTVRIESISYGGIGENEKTEIPAGTAMNIYGEVDYLGPKHRPPERIMSDSITGTDRKWWLTWGDSE